MLSVSERVWLDWHQRMIKRGKKLDAAQELGLRLWMEQGGGRTHWPGWEILVGPKPWLMEQKKLTVKISDRRKSA